MIKEIINIDNSTGVEEVSRLASNEALQLDVTQLDLTRLPPIVKADLYSDATKLQRAAASAVRRHLRHQRHKLRCAAA